MDKAVLNAAFNQIMEAYDLRPSEVQWLADVAEIISKNNGRDEISDGYHTFGELYKHRTILFAAICNMMPKHAWKSRQHDDPNFPMYDGMFIAGITTPYGECTYHADDTYWGIFAVKVVERAPKFDGHTPDDAIDRLFRYSWDIKERDGSDE